MKPILKKISIAVGAAAPFAALVFSASAQEAAVEAYDWICRNPALEISCPQGACEVADSHTPLSVTASAEDFEVCAYSGCWNGVPSATVHARGFTTYTGVRLLYLLDTDDGAHASLTIDTRSGVGTLLVTGYYAQPMICQQQIEPAE